MIENEIGTTMKPIDELKNILINALSTKDEKALCSLLEATTIAFLARQEKKERLVLLKIIKNIAGILENWEEEKE